MWSEILNLKDRQKCCGKNTSKRVKTARSPKKNLTREKHQALKSLRQNESIIILPADKGNATIVIDIENYDAKIKSLLEDPAYQAMTTDPTTCLEKTTKTKIKKSSIDKETQPQVIPREKSSRCPKFYGLLKIHKEDVPLRSTVSSLGSPLQLLARYLAKHQIN
ncbi:hypothetical protein ILUMI_14835 [Ignelater luminosus]|uniref:Uncharacterized protein n=1 Tax=Ignelater luminosus TaxID=2038154 RepID=A0A8K0CPQ6_IGNLU|nr:hypothetical protein ILUMI_14835 [Ignelater luminosus]